MRDEKVSQHYVPRLHLRRFSTNPDSNSVYCYDKQNKRSFPTGVDSTATEDFFYDGKTELVPEMENFLENLEGRVGTPYDKVVENQSISCLTKKEKMTIALFLGVQMVRTRGSRSSMQGMVEGIEESVGRENMAEEFKEELDEMKDEESLRELQNNLIKDASSDFANILAALDWHLFLNETDLPYYTSDFPVVRHNELDFGPYGNLGLRNRGVQIYFPLSPWMLLLIVEPSVYPDLPEVSDTTDRENVVFQRDLQVQRSNRFVYSYRDDFDQAERRIKTSPEVAEPLSERTNVE
ncbi:DUF4238 domain-containing protein [Haloplanus sp. C73]|uniref:DUF4238 domain-containing protein n=1 Tax=Haloplanus sp. C73 TaxID=3421641 RepID=UPI003EBBE946